jgi:hypothetical protein
MLWYIQVRETVSERFVALRLLHGSSDAAHFAAICIHSVNVVIIFLFAGYFLMLMILHSSMESRNKLCLFSPSHVSVFLDFVYLNCGSSSLPTNSLHNHPQPQWNDIKHTGWAPIFGMQLQHFKRILLKNTSLEYNILANFIDNIIIRIGGYISPSDFLQSLLRFVPVQVQSVHKKVKCIYCLVVINYKSFDKDIT